MVHRVAATSAEIAPILSAFLAQKRERFRATGIPDPFALRRLSPSCTGVSLPVTARGHLYVAAFGGFLRLKRLVKQTPWLWQGFTRLRSRLGASSSGAGDLPKRGTA